MKRLLILFLCLLALPAVSNATEVYIPTSKKVVTDYAHHEIHEGNSFSSSLNKTLNNGQTIKFIVNTPAGDFIDHLIVELTSSGESYYEVYEGTTVSSLGGAMEETNHNFNSSNIAGTSITNGPAITSAGTRKNGMTTHIGNGQTTGGIGRRKEVLLKPSTLYLINAVSEANTNDVTLVLEWYESNDFY